MRIAAVHLPRFLVQRRQRDDASLANRPVAVLRPEKGAELVAAASRAALVAGVSVGMTGAQARALCPELKALPDDPLGDLRALEGLAEALLVACPRVELAGPEGLFADASAAPLFGGEAGLLEVMADRCRQLGLCAQLCVADGKFAALALAVHRPRLKVVRGPSAQALAPLPLSALPASEALLWSFLAMGLTTLGQLAALPAAGFAARFGAEGALLMRLARGEDPRPLVPLKPAPPLVESLELAFPAETLEPVLFALKTVLDRLTARLAGRALALTRLEVQLRLDPKGEARVALPLSRPASSARLLISLFRERLGDVKVERPVLGVGVEALETGPAERIQLKLGERPEVDEALEAVLARLKAGLGERALFCARPRATHRPERAWERAPFEPREVGCGEVRPRGPAREASPAPVRRPKKAYLARLLAKGGEAPPGEAPEPEPDPLRAPGARPLRLLGEPRPVEVELSAGGVLTAVRIGTCRHEASAVRGPERLQGEWWRRGFARDYYRAHVEGVGGCWLFCDGRDGRFYLHGYFD